MGQSIRVTGLVLAYLATFSLTPAQEHRAVEKAVSAVQRLGGQVRREGKGLGSPVAEVRLAGTEVADKDLVLLQDLPGLQQLDLAFTRVTDRGLTHLKECPRLKMLSLFGCPGITDMGVENLRRLAGLQHLDLSHTRVTERGLKHLYGLAHLRHLGLQGVQISKEAEARLRQALPRLKIDQGNRNTAQKRVRKHVAIPETTPLTSETIRAAILTRLPAGSSEQEVYSFLKGSGIGKDKFSSYYPADGEGQIVCRIEFDPGSGDLVHTHYGIFFRLDAMKKLGDVAVQEWYTGP